MKKNKYTEDYLLTHMESEGTKETTANDRNGNFKTTGNHLDEELCNDGLFFAEMAKKEENLLIKERYQRAAIVSFAASFEAFLNRSIFELLGQNREVREKVTSGHKIFNYLNGANKPTPQRLSSVTSKMILLEEICNALITEKNTKNKKANNKQAKVRLIVDKNYLIAFNAFEEIILMRDNLVHFSHSKFTELHKEEFEKLSSEGFMRFEKIITTICRLLKIQLPIYISFRNGNKFAEKV